MNRRSFFGFLAVAPVAVPATLGAMSSPVSSASLLSAAALHPKPPRLIDPLQWEACRGEFYLADFIGQRCWVGAAMDWAARSVHVVAVGIEPNGSLWAHHDGFPFLGDKCERHIETMVEVFDVQAIVFEFAGGLWQLARQYSQACEMPNGLIPDATADIVEIIKRGKLRHDADATLTQHVSNVCGRARTNGTVFPCKEHPISANKISAFYALVLANAVARHSRIAA